MKMRAMAGVGVLSLCILFAAMETVCAESVFPSDSIVKQKCSACHKTDEKGRVDVIEATRKSPEEWKAVVDRMIRLNSAPLAEKDFYPVVKELSNYLILSPAEMSTVAYINSDENSQYREIPNSDVEKRLYTRLRTLPHLRENCVSPQYRGPVGRGAQPSPGLLSDHGAPDAGNGLGQGIRGTDQTADRIVSF